MKKTFILIALLSQALYASASDQAACSAAGGSFLTGKVTTAPVFAKASTTLQGVQLSHTHVSVRADQDGRTYDVAMDNVYAVDYVKNAKTMPKSLAAIKVGDKLELCGSLYTSGVGIHWVHSNCGAAPSSSTPDGWVKEVASNGTVGLNLERSQTYCYLWN